MTHARSLPACRVRAFAKVNVDLRVVGRRPDGYHELATVFQSVDLGDRLDIELGGAGFRITCNDPQVPCDHRNLVWRAAHALCDALDVEVPALHVAIAKAIPSETGLGGGSADAAAMLRGLAAIMGEPVSHERLVAVAATLGADVPFMLVGGTALGTGRGDILRPLPDLPPHDVVIVRPDFGVSTAEAYGWFAQQSRGSGTIAPDWTVVPLDWDDALARCRNDLEPPVSIRHAEIQALVRQLEGCGARLAAMTGSGSGVFGLFAPGGAAGRAADALAAPGRTVARARTLGRAEYEELSRPELGTARA